MSEPLDLDVIRKREATAWESSKWDDSNLERDALRASVSDVEPLVSEVEHLCEQIAAVRALHGRMVNNENVCDTCTDHRGLYVLWPCPTLRALGGGVA